VIKRLVEPQGPSIHHGAKMMHKRLREPADPLQFGEWNEEKHNPSLFKKCAQTSLSEFVGKVLTDYDPEQYVEEEYKNKN
jgi:hypothetical protein